jgi:hypothetical protein
MPHNYQEQSLKSQASWYSSVEEAYDAGADLMTERDAYESPSEITSYAADILVRIDCEIKK